LFKRYLRPLLSGSMLGCLLAFPLQSMQAALEALQLFARSVLPSLFPFTACMLLLTAGKCFPSTSLVCLSLLGGSPTGARLFQDASLTTRQARRIAAMTGVMSPMFFLGTMSLWLQNASAGWLILLCHLLGALLSGVFFKKESARVSRISLPPLPVGQAILQAASAMLTVGGCITLGTVAARMAECLFPLLDTLPLALMQCLLEVTSGCKTLIGLSFPLKLPLLCFTSAFGGLSILLQNAAYWGRHQIALSQLFLYGLLRGVIAFLVCFVILLCHPAGFAV